MERKEILSTQRVEAKTWKSEFQSQSCDEGIRYVYEGGMTANAYCVFLGIDFHTVSLLGEVGYAIEYNCIEGNKYVLKCETYIDVFRNENLSFELEDNEDYLGLFTKKEEQKIGVAQWLPSNWKELMSDEQKEEIAKEWCEKSSVTDFLSDSEKEEIADDYIEQNNSDV